MNIIRKICLLVLISYCGGLSSQAASVVCDSVKIYFRQGKTDLLPSFSGNKASLDRISDSLSVSKADSVYRLQRILVVGGASPEGSVNINRLLSEKRAGVLFAYLSRYGELPDSLKTTKFLGRDWNGLVRLAENDPDLPYSEETLELLRTISREVHSGILTGDAPLYMLQQLHGGLPWSHMYYRLFPKLRASSVYLFYEKVLNPEVQPQCLPSQMPELVVSTPKIDTILPLMPKPLLPALQIDTIPPIGCVKSATQTRSSKPFYMALKTNMLYDLAAVPNLGAEFYLGHNFSAVANWMYAWWHTDRRHRYWRVYGGDIALRWWFGSAARSKPLTGHHIGVYAGLLTYDFEWGGRGYMGGSPGGTLWDRCNHMFGVEYGYSLPIARRLNIDFSLGLGYLGGEYSEYTPIDDCYVWQTTKRRRFFGPTKAEISLMWLIGNKNWNERKGGRR